MLKEKREMDGVSFCSFLEGEVINSTVCPWTQSFQVRALKSCFLAPFFSVMSISEPTVCAVGQGVRDMVDPFKSF